METPEAAFVSMVMERLAAVEKQNDELKNKVEILEAKLETHENQIYLTPHSMYKDFNDGWSLNWELLKEPTMVDERRIVRDEITNDDFVPLDEAHWNAIVFPSHIWLQVGNFTHLNIYATRLKIGRVGEPVTLRILVRSTSIWNLLRKKWNWKDTQGFTVIVTAYL